MSDLEARMKKALGERYDLKGELGHGGMATVFLAADLQLGRQVAIKVLLPELVASVGADRFLREIRIVANLQHPNILVVRDGSELTLPGRLGFAPRSSHQIDPIPNASEKAVRVRNGILTGTTD